MEFPSKELCGILVPFLPEKWKKLVFVAVTEDESWEMNYFVRTLDQQLIEASSCVKDVSEYIIALSEISAILDNYYKKLPNDERWKTVTFLLWEDGLFKVEFGFSEIEDIREFIEMQKEIC